MGENKALEVKGMGAILFSQDLRYILRRCKDEGSITEGTRRHCS